VPGERQLFVHALDLLEVSGVEQGRAAYRESDRVAKQRLSLADATEKVERLVENGIPLRRIHAAVEPFAIRDDFEIVERFRVRTNEAGENRVEKKTHSQLRGGREVGLSPKTGSRISA
jgi:hypothetical protein